MKKMGFSAIRIAFMSLFIFSATGWAYTPPTPRESQDEQQKVTSQANLPPSSYDVQEGPLSAAGDTKEIKPEQAAITPHVIRPSEKISNSTIDISQGMDAVQKALDLLPENGILQITGQGALNSDSLRIPAHATINLEQKVSLVLGDPTAGNLPAEVKTGSIGTGSPTAASPSSGARDLLTVDGLKADIQQLQTNLKAATPQAQKEIRTAIQRDRDMIREMRQANMKSIHKNILPVVRKQTKKKKTGATTSSQQ